MPNVTVTVCPACASQLAMNRGVSVRHSGSRGLRDAAAACPHVLADLAARDPKQLDFTAEPLDDHADAS